VIGSAKKIRKLIKADLMVGNIATAKAALDLVKIAEDQGKVLMVGHVYLYHPAVRKLTETTRNFNRLTLKVEKSLDRGDYNIKKIFEPLLVNIEILSDQINAMAKEFEESPSDIFFKARKTRRGPGE